MAHLGFGFASSPSNPRSGIDGRWCSSHAGVPTAAAATAVASGLPAGRQLKICYKEVDRDVERTVLRRAIRHSCLFFQDSGLLFRGLKRDLEVSQDGADRSKTKTPG